MESKAVARFIRVSPLKVRIVAANVAGQPVGKAVQTLTFTTKRAAQLLLKVLKSALSNAEQNIKDVDVDTLFVKSVSVDEGPMMKRLRARAQGRAYRIRKRTSHITVVLDEA